MSMSATTNALAAASEAARRDRDVFATRRLWPSLLLWWTQRLDARIEQDLRWLDHAGVLDDHRRASRG